ncbi:Bug family tripartite tricarboxylate transporter substrate binding protein [Candidimonas nitroreducens]|uniref:ABC transporter substrate-binding protein n=1 Tax=Candidimonas nitroreducens TaxID=683354 RepID=A0A225MFT6_9BURK|nr:tripartite tricarboxylate transporter substrate binding protein [Candidimonas nitroreducens]OWT60177.1 hypothetical protein CEY11_10940 [Candidimonas nitroreducens]
MDINIELQSNARKKFVALGIALIGALSLQPACVRAAGSEGEQWPVRPLKVIVGYPAGTSPDFVARLLAEPLSRDLGQPVIVENKSGAAGNIAVANVARSTDGYTIGVTAQGPLTTSKLLYRSLPYDVSKDLQPLSVAAVSPQLLIVDPKLPVKSLGEFLRYVKAQKPDALAYGSVGVGSGSHLTTELFDRDVGIHMTHVPYQGFHQVTMAVMSGQIQAAFMAPSGALEQARAGKVKVLGVTSAQPSPVAPGIPSIAQAAKLPDFSAELWIGVYAPQSMPQAVAERLSRDIQSILHSAQAKKKLAEQDWVAVGSSRQEMVQRIKADTDRWGKVIELAGVRPH